MLRYRADIRTLLFIATFFGLVVLGYVWQPSAWWQIVPLVVLCSFFSFFGAVITHNTLHCPMFLNRKLNRFVQVVLTMTYGHPVSAFVPGHNLSHHKHTQTRRDVMRTTKMRFRWNLLNGLLFFFRMVPDILKGEARYREAMRKRMPSWHRQWLLEQGLLFAFLAAALIIDWKSFLLYVFIPHRYAGWGIVTMNLLQHDGCGAESKYDHSRNFVGAVVNFFTFNNGYHTIHHEHPALHWSLCPAAHDEQIAPHIHPELDQKSLLAFLWRTYGWPGKRLTFDGKPVVLPNEGPDEDWIPKPEETLDDLGAIRA
jgi:fatty acid desaturase